VAASIRVLRLRVLVALIWFVAGLILLSNYTWEHYPAPTCERPGQLAPEYLFCPDDHVLSGADVRLSDSDRERAPLPASRLGERSR
jgi:hypothetical protein